MNHSCFFLNISRMEDKEDPTKTRTTPTTSIQLMYPGRIDDSTVYWAISMNTTSVLTIAVTVLPEMYFVHRYKAAKLLHMKDSGT